ncbi:MAG TPA: hypothetical protein VHR66_10295 [Gemmataceae bacterium]|jgi:hypothetical protein|nr:hypothetical protein [Gemmataceae bacterium]
MSLDTLANVKARLGVTTLADDTLIGLLQDSGDTVVANYCNRDFAGGTFTEYFPGGSEFVPLRNFPVASVTSVKVDPAYAFGSDTVVPTTAYVVHTDRGVIQALGGPFVPGERTGLVNVDVRGWTAGPRVVQVVYTTATGQVPADIKEAYARLIGYWYRHVKTNVATTFQNVAQQKYGETFVIFSNNGSGLPLDVTELLDLYRVPVI